MKLRTPNEADRERVIDKLAPVCKCGLIQRGPVRRSVLLLMVAISSASCGGDDGESQEDRAATVNVETAVESTYFAEGNAACVESTDVLLEISPQMSPLFDEDRFPAGAVEPYGRPAGRQAEIIEDLAAELDGLEAPADRDILAAQLVQALETEATALRAIQQAAETGSELDPRIETGLSVDHLARLGIATSVGLDACSERIWP